MKKAKIKIGEKEFPLEDNITTIGRAPDNKIIIQDSNVSRYHAEIEYRNGEFWFTDLKSSNGSFLNDSPIHSTVQLKNKDLINLGGTSEIEFIIEEETLEEELIAEKTAHKSNEDNKQLPESKPEAKQNNRLFKKSFLALTILLLLLGLSIILLLVLRKDSECKAKAIIDSPENGDVISQETQILISVENADCIRQIIISLNDHEIAQLEEQPFSAKIDPEDFPELADGGNYPLQVFIEDTKGNRILSSSILLAFETITPPTSEDQVTETPEDQINSNLPRKPEKISLIETQRMIQKIISQFSNRQNYKFEEDFLEAVRRATEEYTKEEGFSNRAEAYRDLINIEFHKENGLDAPLGFLLAMSRSKFKPEKRGQLEGLWQLSEDFIKKGGYKDLCPESSLSDKDQVCAAKTAAIYTKALVFKIFNGDFIYAVAAFGMTEQEAVMWANSLPQDRANFWKIIENRNQKENLVKFFAASIVADNPQSFGLKTDKPISSLYRNLILGSNL
ncbi:MAG: FHA domain-containing protein [Pyrinomonadaceae bacterium]|nr:FHA domain-containing protein [Pyrinomonadaceae bacterium]